MYRFLSTQPILTYLAYLFVVSVNKYICE